jgi:O-antigen ligase
MEDIQKIAPTRSLVSYAASFTAVSLLISNKLNSISIILLVVAWLLEGGFRQRWQVLRRQPFVYLCAGLYACYVLSYFFSEDQKTAAFFLEKKLSLLLLPPVLLSATTASDRQLAFIRRVFIAGVLLMALVSVAIAIRQFVLTGSRTWFFYHKLSDPVGFSAIVASLFASLAFVLLCAEECWNKWTVLCALVLFGWILLLTSKLFLLVMLLLVFMEAGRRLSRRSKWLLLSVLLGLCLLFSWFDNPLRRRFEDMAKFRPEYLEASSFGPDKYFDGLSLRLIYLKFSVEIMREKGHLLRGVGSGDAEQLLRQKITDYRMYTGNGRPGSEGYLKYGFHNQYLQVLVQMGLSGLLAFVGLLLYCIRKAIKEKNQLLLGLMLVFCLSFLTDTLMEHQVGLVSFLLFTSIALRSGASGTISASLTPIKEQNRSGRRPDAQPV